MAKILVIEDNQAVRLNIVEILEAEGFNVFSASDGKSAISLADEISPDLIISDIIMPGMDGYDVLTEVMKNTKLSIIPFIFLTGKVEPKDLRNGMELGADDYIFKPFDARELITAVKVRLNKYKNLRSAPLNKIEKSEKKVSKEKNKNQKTILINDGGELIVLKISEIIAIVADKENTQVYLKNCKNLFVRKLLKNWEENLPDDIFFRIHRSTIININLISKIDKLSKRSYLVYMENMKKPFTISDRYALKLKRDLAF